MPFQPINFAGIEPQGNEFMRNLAENLSKAYKSGFEMKEMPGQLKRNRESEELANAFQKMKMQAYPEQERMRQALEQAKIAESNRKANLPTEFQNIEGLPAKVAEFVYAQNLKNTDPEKYAEYNQYLESQNEFKGFGTAPLKEQRNFNKLFQKDNPKFSEDQFKEAKDKIMRGEDILSDGTPINLSKETENSLDRLTRYGSPAGIISGNIRSAQAEAELPIVTDFINDTFGKFGDIYWGYQPEQIIKQFGKDEKSQKDLGDLIAADALAVEKAFVQQMLASSKTTVSGTNEILSRSGNLVKRIWPKLTPTAYKESQSKIQEVIGNMYKARRSVPVGSYRGSLPIKEHKVGDKITAGAEENPTKILQWDPKLGRTVEVTQK